MAVKHNFLGIKYFGLGTPGDGVMGTSLTNFPDIEPGSVTFEGPDTTQENIPTEDDDTYLTVNADTTPASISARLYGITPAEMVILAGGEVDGTKWKAPRTTPNIYLSLRMEGKEINGSKGVLEIPYGKVKAKQQGTITKNGIPAVDIQITANTPVAADGTKGSPYHWGTETV